MGGGKEGIMGGFGIRSAKWVVGVVGAWGRGSGCLGVEVDTVRGMSRLLGNAMSALVLVFALV